MTALQTPAPDAPAEEWVGSLCSFPARRWGRLAVSIPGWRWMPGMIDTYPSFRLVVDYDPELDDLSDSVPDPDDPATAGCLLALLGPCEVGHDDTDPECGPWSVEIPGVFRMGPTLGRACIAAAAALGRWPGGDS